VRALDAVDATLAGGERALQRVIGRLGARAHELFVNEQERAELHDWDSPADVEKSKGYQAPGSEPSSIHFGPSGQVPAFIPPPKEGPTMDVQIKQQPELRCFCVRHLGPYDQIPEAFDRLHQIAVRAELEKLPNVLLLGLYHDDVATTPAAELRSDAALVVPEGVPVPNELVEQRLPAGKYAMTTYVGPYEGIGDAWARLMGKWLPASGERVGCGSSYEIYRNTPADVPKEKLVTEIYVPLA
jgi:AraC family transcriptional regulator